MMASGYRGRTNSRGERHGDGCYTFPGGTFVYSGEWQHGHMEGRGSLTVFGPLDTHSTIEGEFEGGEIRGQGTRTWYEQGIPVKQYRGEFDLGEASGKGEFMSATEHYAGGFLANLYEGQGTKMIGDVGASFMSAWYGGDIECARLDGEWRRNKLHGRGSEKRPDGHSFNGTFVDGVRRQGDATWLGGAVYSGEWDGEDRNGRGEYRCAQSGVCYHGNWLRNVPVGRAVALSAAFEQQDKVDASGTKTDKSSKGKRDTTAVTLLTVRAGAELPGIVIEARHSDAGSFPAEESAGEAPEQTMESADARVATGESGRRIIVTLLRKEELLDEGTAALDFFVKNQMSERQTDAAESTHKKPIITTAPDVDEDAPETVENGDRVDKLTATLESGRTNIRGVVLSPRLAAGSYVIEITDVSRQEVQRWSLAEAAVFPQVPSAMLAFSVEPP
ncbi:hypothetical protein CTAYLR_006065 [Chrysophaeum taylorii]|uniref:Uncharacterized protein n=1 Tax=Chrysophaeum taylorii TaxID=2483200 RepID=A0AAD7UK71_9STRA|nr:hypothetical protein CTAYLR_006065 [Chrysophaeum taylorii]